MNLTPQDDKRKFSPAAPQITGAQLSSEQVSDVVRSVVAVRELLLVQGTTNASPVDGSTSRYANLTFSCGNKKYTAFASETVAAGGERYPHLTIVPAEPDLRSSPRGGASSPMYTISETTPAPLVQVLAMGGNLDEVTKAQSNRPADVPSLIIDSNLSETTAKEAIANLPELLAALSAHAGLDPYETLRGYVLEAFQLQEFAVLVKKQCDDARLLIEKLSGVIEEETLGQDPALKSLLGDPNVVWQAVEEIVDLDNHHQRKHMIFNLSNAARALNIDVSPQLTEALLIGVVRDDADLIRTLYHAGAPLDGERRDGYGSWPVQEAVALGKMEAFKALVQLGVSLQGETVNGYPSLLFEIARRASPSEPIYRDMLSILAMHGGHRHLAFQDHFSNSDSYETPLLLALHGGDKAFIQRLLEFAAPSPPSGVGEALGTSICGFRYGSEEVHARPDIALTLLPATYSSRDLSFALIQLAGQGDAPLELVQALLERGADPTLRLSACKVILGDDVPLHYSDPSASALVSCARSGEREVMEALLVKAELLTEKDLAALARTARESRNSEVTAYLEEKLPRDPLRGLKEYLRPFLERLRRQG